MATLKNTLRKRQFQLHLVALLLMFAPAAGTYFAARSGADSMVWALIVIVILGNLVAVVVP
jgi:hypothetical protein